MAQYGASSLSGMFAFPNADGSVHESCPVALRLLNVTWGAAWEVMHEFRLLLGNLGRVENVDISALPDLEHTSILQTENPSGPRREAPDALANRVEPTLANPVGQNEAAPARIHDLGNVRPRIAQAREDVPTLEKVPQFIEALVEHAERKQPPPVTLSAQTEKRLDKVLSGFFCPQQ